MYINKEWIKFPNCLLFSISVSFFASLSLFLSISLSLSLSVILDEVVNYVWLRMAFLIICTLYKRNEPPGSFGSMSFLKYWFMCSEFHFISFTEIWERPSCCSLHINANENIQETSVYTLMRSSRKFNKQISYVFINIVMICMFLF